MLTPMIWADAQASVERNISEYKLTHHSLEFIGIKEIDDDFYAVVQETSNLDAGTDNLIFINADTVDAMISAIEKLDNKCQSKDGISSDFSSAATDTKFYCALKEAQESLENCNQDSMPDRPQRNYQGLFDWANALANS